MVMIVPPQELREMRKQIKPYLVGGGYNQLPTLSDDAPKEIQELYQVYLQENKTWREKTRSFREISQED